MDDEAHDGHLAIASTSTLVCDMRRVLREGQSFSDMVFICAADGGVDGVDVEVPAWRMLVAMRSPVLEHLLLRRDMAEALSNRIHLPAVESTTMRICLEFFYTDTVQHTSWPDGSISLPMKVIAAAHFFLVDALQQVAISFLLSTTTWMHYQHGNEDDICARLAATPELLKEIVFAFNLGVQLEQARPCEHLQKVLKRLGRVVDIGSLSCGRFVYHKHISGDAMLHLLESQTVSWGDASMWEYSRLQHVVQWCVYEYLLKDDHPVAEEVVIQAIVNRALPWEYNGSIDRIALATSLSDAPLDMVVHRVIEALALQVQKLLSMVRIYFEDIPSIILVKFIEPLAIVPASTLALAHELQASDKWEDMRWDSYPGNEGEKNDHGVIMFSCNSDQFFGVAPCNLCDKFPEATTLEWEIRILKACKRFKVGFGLARPRRERFDGSNNWFWSLCSFGVLQYNGKTRHCREIYGEGEIVRVHIDMHSKVCSFLINDRYIGASCDDLPLNGQVYPAIYMCKPGKVQVRFLCGN